MRPDVRSPEASGLDETSEERLMAADYEIPAEMRDFADRSVAQARKAFEGFMGAVHKAGSTFDEATGSASTTAKQASEKIVAYAESNVTAAFDLATRLVHAKDLSEVIKLQTEFAQNQITAAQAQAKELADAIQKASGLTK
jgi:phasin